MHLNQRIALQFAITNLGLLLLLIASLAWLWQQQLSSQQQRFLQETSQQLMVSLRPILDESDPQLVAAILDGATQNPKIGAGEFQLANGNIIWQRSGKAGQRFDTLIEQQWRPLGNLQLTANPDWPSQQLQQQLLQITPLLLLLFIAFNGILLWRVTKLLSPISKFIDQLQQIHKRQGPSQLVATSAITEFKQLQHSINQLAQTQPQGDPQHQQIEQLQQQLYQDPLSGLGNRLMLQTRLEQWVQRGGSGVLMLLHLPLLNRIRQLQNEVGYRRQCIMFKQLVEQLLIGKSVTMVRLQQHELAVLITDIDETELPNLATKIIEQITATAEKFAQTDINQHRLIMLHSIAPHDPSAMLAKLDNLLSQSADSDYRQPVIRNHNSQATVRGRQQWLELVRSAMLNDQVVLKQQAAISPQGELLHYEVLSQLMLTGESCRAGQFIPPLEASGAIAEFDRFVITKVLERLTQRRPKHLTAVNLSPVTLGDAGFIRWFKQQLELHQQLKNHLVFELPESAFFHQKEQAMLVCELLHGADFHFAIDHFGRHLQEISYLTELPMPQYVKLDYLFSQRLHEPQQRELLSALCRTTQNLGLFTIATRIENSEQLSLFQQLKVDGIQGYISYNWEEAQLL